jgi:hypothetical protein
MKEVTRRDALAGATALGAFALAGCVADENGDAPAESGDDDESEDTTDNSGETGGDADVDASGEDGASGRTDSDRHSNEDSKDDDSDGHRGDETDSADSDEREDRDDDESDSADGNEREDRDDDESDSAEGNEREDRDDDESDSAEGNEREDGKGNEREDGSNDDRDGDRRPDGKEVVLNHTVETTDTGCTAKSLGTARKRDVSRADGVVTVEGTLVTSTPCHSVIVESVRYNSGDLALAVSVEPQPGVCIECLGEITYEATVTLSEGVAVDTVSVTYVETDPGVDGGGLSGRPES